MIDRAARVAAGQATADDLAWLRAAFAAWIAAEGAVSLERCARLPASPGHLRIALRDQALVAAADELEREQPASSRAELAQRLRQALALYAGGGDYRAWRHARELPEGVSPLRAALHQALRHSGTRLLSVRQVERVLAARQTSDQNCRAPAGTMSPSPPPTPSPP